MALRRKSGGGQSNDLFPGFTDVAHIGDGSISTVFRAREQDTNRRVALKLLNVRDTSSQALESFQRESIALGELGAHPNIVTLYRSCQLPDGRPVLVLELCTGSVGDRIRNGSGLPVAEAVSIGIKVAGALETAHRARILHRDVKPQNILITGFGEPALADFGVAMLQSSTQTTAGLFDFTTLHAAPELLEGRETSAATDVYELASTLYQMVSGYSAFRAFDGESPASVILRILRDPVRPLTDIPMQLSDLLIEAMAKDMDQRPSSAAEFAAELARIEAAQGWPRTQFVAPGPPPAPVPPSAPVLPRPPVRTVRPTAPVVRPAVAPAKLAKPVAPAAPVLPAPPRVSHPEQPGGQYPIPPAAVPLADPAGKADVPTWARRDPVPTGPQFVGDIAIDPQSLHRKLSVRSGLSVLTVDEQHVVSRSGMHRTQLLWADVLGFQARIEEPGQPGSPSFGSLAALTAEGRVELPATRRPASEVPYLHALLDAYRIRAQASR